MTRHTLLSAIPLLLYSITLSAQGTAEDYNRAYSLRDKYSSRKYFYTNANPRWQQDSDTFWYVRNTPDGDVLVTVDAATLTETVERDKAVLEAKLKEERDKLPRPSPRHWMEVDDEKGSAPVPSPDGKWLAFIKNDNVFVRSTDGKEERQLSTLGTAGNYYSSYIQWSPDGKYLATCRIRPAEKRYVYYVESSPTDQLQPKLHKQEYAKPGDELRFKVPCIFSLDGTQRLIPDTRLFSNQFDLYGPSWREDSKGITFEYNERGHKVYRILEMSAADGSVRPLVEETNDKYIFYNRLFRHILKGGTQLIWSSERDNYNHLYLINTKDGSVAKQITCGQWYVRQVIKVDEDTKQIYFSASGVNKDEDPYLIHYYRIGFDGKNMTCLTPEEGHHKS